MAATGRHGNADLILRSAPQPGRLTAVSPVPGARDPKLAERVAAAIEADVLRAGWPVGLVLGAEEQLAARYGVGRAVIREAIRLAEHRQVARTRRGRGGGLVVVAPDASAVTESLSIYLEYARASLDDLLEARAVLAACTAGAPDEPTPNAALSLFIQAIGSLSDQLTRAGRGGGAAGPDDQEPAAGSAAPGGGPRPYRPANAVATRIRREIVRRGWPVGESLGFEGDLLREYGVGRAQFREAIRILENHSVVRMQRGAAGGMVVAVPDGQAVVRAASLYLTYRGMNSRHIRDLREELEAATTRMAIDRLDAAGEERLSAMIELERTWPDEDFPAVSHDLHAIIAELSGNQTLALLVSIVMQLTAERLHAGDPGRITEPPDATRHAHQAIVKAMLARDTDRALRRMRKHLNALARWTVDRPGRRPG